MANRKAGIRVPLTAEQRAAIKAATGEDVTEVVFVGETKSAAPLRNEVTSTLEKVLVRTIGAKEAGFNQILKYSYGAEAKPSPGRAKGSKKSASKAALIIVR